MARVLGAAVLHEVFGLFVNGVVRQVHEEVVEVAAEGRHVVLRREASQALLEDEDAKWNH